MTQIEYRTTDIRGLELIRPLWLQLNEHHHAMAGMFRSHYEQMTFNDRKKYFECVARTGSLRLDLAWDPVAGRFVGYCVSSLSEDKIGEIESIFLENGYRSQGIGSALMLRALVWMDEGGATRKRVSVGDGNEGAWKFYEKFGFYPRMTILEQKTEFIGRTETE
jgi:ribosomal protein S18 acetylase RimI-like enzyme